MRSIRTYRTVILSLALIMGIASRVEAASGTWTATGAGQVGYWTNNANWTGATYPGSDGASQNAYLTNGTANTYTSILDANLANTISTLAISNKGGGQAWLIVTNATLTNTTFSMSTGGRLQIDNGGVVTGITSFTWNGVNGLMNINSGSLYKTSGDLTIGDAAGADGNRLTVNGGTVQAAGYIRVGRSGHASTMIVSNAAVNSVGLEVGWLTYSESSSSNTVTVGTGTVWNAGGGRINIGADSRYANQPASYPTNNVLIVDGGVITNAIDLSIYRFYSRLTITNGGKVYSSGPLAQGTTGNVVTVTGPGSYLKLAGFTLGNNSDGRASNALLIANGGVINGTTPTFQGGQVTITGAGSAYSNAGNFSVAGNYASILADAGGKITFSGLAVSGASNTMTFSGSGSGLLRSGANANFTLGGSYNSLTFSNGAALDIGFGSGFSVGNGSGYNYNSLNIGGLGASCTFTGQYNDVVGGSGGMGNSITVTNATVYRGGNTWGMTVGNASPSNTITIAAGGIWDGGTKDKIVVGTGAATGNVLRVNAGGVITNLQSAGIVVGNSATASGNRAIIDGGSVFLAGATMSVANGTDNQAILQNGGLVEAGTLSVVAGAGNLITNSGGIYQFNTATPTITTNGDPNGSIFLNGGTISYRGVSSGLALTANWSSDLKKMTWLGNNTLRLNASTASAPTGGYVFNTGISPTNYSRLEMINGTTAITGSGNPITIGANGSLMVRDTAASIAGIVTNLGTLEILGGTLTCSSNLVLGAGATTVVGLQQTTSGCLRVTGTFTPGGTLTITNTTGSVLAGGQSWNLFDWTGGPINFAATNLPALGPLFSWDTSQFSTNGVLSVVSSGGTVTNVWDGDTSTDWNTDANWAEGHVPTPSEMVRIANNSPTYWPLLDMNRTAPTLLLETGAQLSLNGKNLTISSNLVMTGTMIASGAETVTVQRAAAMNGGSFTAASSTVVIGGTGSQTLNFSNITFNALLSQNAGAVTIDGPFRAASVTHTGGNAAFNGGFSATNFTVAAPGATLTFQSNVTVAVTNLTLAGSTASPLVLVSSAPGSKWLLNVSGASYVTRVTVSDSDAGAGRQIRPVASSEGTPGSTVNWDFGPATWKVWTGGSTDFHGAANWNPSGAPGPGDNLLIETTNGMSAPLQTSPVTLANLAIGGLSTASLELRAAMTVTNRVRILSGSTLTHTTNGATAQYWIDLTVGGDLEIASGGAINASAKGYSENNGPAPAGEWDDPAASHGGEGGDGTGGVRASPTYGSITNPTTLGSGGNSGTGANPYGGGAILLIVTGNTVLDGIITANAGSGGNGAPAPAGGSVNLKLSTLSGSGSITANGGEPGGGNTKAGGGGGRIAVRLSPGTSFGSVTMLACGGGLGQGGGLTAAAGTIYQQTASQGEGNGTLIIDAAGVTVPNNAKTLIATNVTDKAVGSVLLRNNARLAVQSNATLYVAGSFTNDATSTFVAKTNSTVSFVGATASTVWGSQTWYTLSITSATKTVYFQAGKTNWVNGALLLRNATLRSTTDNTQWHIRLANDAAQSVENVFVKDSNATNGQMIVAWPYSRNQGNNVNWFFHPDPGSVFRMR